MTPTPIHRFRRADGIALLLVVCVALIVRFSAFGETEYYDDMAELSARAQAILQTGQLPLIGQQAAGGVPNTPISLYLIAAMYKLVSDPLAISAIITLLGVIGVGAVFVIGQRYGGLIVGAAAGILYAVNPWAVFYSQRAFLPDFNTPFIIIGILLACIGFLEGKRWAQILCFPIFLIGVQVQLAGFVLLPLLGVIILLGRRNIRPLATGIGLVFGALTVVPFILGLLSWNSTSPLGVGGALAGRSLSLSGETLLHWLQTTTGIGLETIYPPGLQNNVWINYHFPVALWALLLIALAIGLVSLWRTRRTLAILFTIWIILHLLVFSTNWISVPPYYLTTVAPGLMLVCGFGMGEIWRWSGTRPAFKAGLVTLIGVIAVSQSLYWHTLSSLMEQDLTFYTPLHYFGNIRHQLAPYDDVVLIGGEGRIHRIWVWKPILYRPGRCVRELAIAEGGIELLPAHPFAVLFAPPTSADLSFAPDYRTGQELDLPLRAGEIGYTAYLYGAPPAIDHPALTTLSPETFDNGVVLDSYALSQNRAYLSWQLPAATSANYQVFIHFLNAAGDQVGQRDTAFYPTDSWCAGDHIITWIDAPLPPGAVTARVGMYRLSDDGAVIGANANGEAGTQPWVTLDLKPQ